MPDLFLFYILLNAMFGSVVASSTIASLGGGGEESLALFHRIDKDRSGSIEYNEFVTALFSKAKR